MNFARQIADLYLKQRRFRDKAPAEQWNAIKATFGLSQREQQQRHIHRFVTGPYAPPNVTRQQQPFYIAYRPDSDAAFSNHPELAEISEKWVHDNVAANGGDLPRLYALLLNIKQIFAEQIPGELAELGVFRGNSAAVFAHYARLHSRTLWLFDTFQGFDRRDLVGADAIKTVEFSDTSIDNVRALVGDEAVRIVKGRFPESVTSDLQTLRFCLVHIDCDLYEPAKAGLEFFYPRLSPGALIILHDYANPYWPGIKRAVDEFCKGIPERVLVFGDKSGTAMIRKSMVA